jgi:hypothetical protein
MRRRGRLIPMPHSRIEPWAWRRMYEEDMASTREVDFTTAPSLEVLIHLQRLCDWSNFLAVRGLTAAERAAHGEWKMKWAGLIPAVTEAVGREADARLH